MRRWRARINRWRGWTKIRTYCNRWRGWKKIRTYSTVSYPEDESRVTDEEDVRR